MILLHLSQLEKQVLDLAGEESAEILELEDSELLRVASDLRYKLHAELISGEVLVTGRVEADLAGICGRCLSPVKTVAGTDNICLYLEPGDSEELDITEEIRAEMLLSLPISLLCNDDCKGLCPQCGCNLNEKNCHCPPPPPPTNAWNALDDLKL